MQCQGDRISQIRRKRKKRFFLFVEFEYFSIFIFFLLFHFYIYTYDIICKMFENDRMRIFDIHFLWTLRQLLLLYELNMHNNNRR